MNENKISINTDNMNENMKNDFEKMLSFQETGFGKNIKTLLDSDKIDMAEHLLQNPNEIIEIMD